MFTNPGRYAAVALMLALPGTSSAEADKLVMPFVGGTLGGDTTENRTTFGVSVAGMAGGTLGFELDLSRTPGFFGDPLGDDSLTTVTGNLVVGMPMGAVRPYVLGGFGLFRTQIASGAPGAGSRASNDLGVDVGAGLLGFFGEHLGGRADLRYFRNVTSSEGTLFDFDLGSFDFWRASIGMTLRF